ncbi:MAG: ABC transporter permease [Bacteroidota bacterium]|nr:ABC transporter permease [Bacteroidota bacterium]
MGFLKRYFHDINIAFESILSNKLRSFLTALGIIFGVAAVISMLAIGNGAQQEILEQIKMVGVNNIVIMPRIIEEKADESGSASGTGSQSTSDVNSQSKKFSPGLTLNDVNAIKASLPTIKLISPEIIVSNNAILSGVKQEAKLFGVSRDYFDIYNLKLEKGGYFDPGQEEEGMAVCIIGANIQSKFFPQSNPVGQYIKFGKVWLRVIGVIEKNNIKLTGYLNAGVNVINDNIFIPVKTMLLRYQNRGQITAETIRQAAEQTAMGQTVQKKTNMNQLDKIVVQVKETEQLQPTVEVVSRLISRRHSDVKDVDITVPEMLLKQQQKTKEIFNFVLGAIASISLVVGGIGIMNIMFASVMERIKEIGTRMAIGAKKMDIVVQFLSEAVLISVSGGLIGVVLGVVASMLISHLANIVTIISPFSVIVAFVVSASVGIIFGYSPAKRASERDPIESLRYE